VASPVGGFLARGELTFSASNSQFRRVVSAGRFVRSGEGRFLFRGEKKISIRIKNISKKRIGCSATAIHTRKHRIPSDLRS
jgi:hypothetical protein